MFLMRVFYDTRIRGCRDNISAMAFDSVRIAITVALAHGRSMNGLFISAPATGCPAIRHAGNELANACLLQADGLQANIVTFNTLIDAMGKAGRWQDAIGVLDIIDQQVCSHCASNLSSAVDTCLAAVCCALSVHVELSADAGVTQP